MYVIEVYHFTDGPRQLMLHQMTKAQIAELTTPTRAFLPVAAEYAHRWVRDGRPHSTPLWIAMDGRIRRAA